MTMATKITFVLYATNYEYVKQTYQSLKKQDMSDVKLVLVIDEKEQQLSCGLRELMGDGAEYLLVNPDEGIGQIREAVGGLVFFLKEGMRFRGDTVKKLAAYAAAHEKEKDGKTVLIPVAVDKKNPVSMEYEEYVKGRRTDRDLEKEYGMLCRMYFAHGIPADRLLWEEGQGHAGAKERAKEADKDMELSIIRLVTVSVCSARRIAILRGGCVWMEGFRVMEKIVVRYMESYEGIAAFGDRFFLPLMDRFAELGLLERKNGQYLLIYYVNRALSAMTQLEKKGVHRPEGLEQIYADALRMLPDFEMLAVHPYITVGSRYAMVRSFFPEAGMGHSRGADLILGLQYRLVYLYEMKPHDNMLYLEFTFMKMQGEVYELYCVVNGREYACTQGALIRKNEFLDWEFGRTDIYTVEVPLEGNMEIYFAGKENGTGIPFETILFQKSVPLSNRVFLSKKLKGKVYYADDACSRIYVRRPNPLRWLALETKHIRSMLQFGMAGYKALAARALYHLQKTFSRREVWLLTDRANRADDNGEVMFCYLSSLADKKRDVYFVIDSDTDDNRRMQQYGKTVAPFSWKHKMLYLRSCVTMSSQANKMVYDPFGMLGDLYRDIVFEKRLVFLQHGVTKDNQSAWLNKYNRNLYGFVVNTRAEYDSVFTYDYYYKPERVWLTGMPRFDRLYHDEQKYVTIMPTWRKSLSKGTDENGVWLLDDDFKKSDYFLFYNALLNDERLLAAAERLGYTVCFMPHPNTITGLKYFQKHAQVQFFDMTKSYREVFAQTDLMVTDYSSVAFDFAYLRKPIIYAQFDRADFFSGAHSYTEGYFDYDRDGFGEVTMDLDTTVDAIIRSMEQGCTLEDTYRQRIDATFAFDDQDCCRRVLERFEKERRNER